MALVDFAKHDALVFSQDVIKYGEFLKKISGQLLQIAKLIRKLAS